MGRIEMKNILDNKNVLVTGGTGMIGRYLVDILLEKGCKVKVVSLDSPEGLPEIVDFQKLDLTSMENCLTACDGQDYVFNLIGIKGSPKMSRERPASFMVPMLMFNTAMMEAAMRCNVEWYLYTSSVGVYHPSETFNEDDVWKTFPSEHDKFPGWAKRIGELQAEAYGIQNGKKNISIVRPANVYGKWDNFDPENAMVIPSLINRIVSGESPLTVWGDGTPIRDFIHAKDCARGMIHVVENCITDPINLGSGTGITIKELAETVRDEYDSSVEIEWDTSKPKGDHKRIMNTLRAESHGFTCEVSLSKGISETIAWFIENRDLYKTRNNYFKDKSEN
jgi:GDP-L-fucose synthase